ncbi:hypothetical protein JCM6882_008848 [Rhodosporidiobolus microsporus]
MPLPTKRPRSRSPSPTLPLHLLTSLPSHPSTSRNTLITAGDDRARALRLPDHLAHGVEAHEAALLSAGEGGEWETLREELEEDVVEAGGRDSLGNKQGKGRRRVKWTGTVGEEGREVEVWTDRYDLLHLLPSLPSHLPHPAPVFSSTTPANTSTSDPPAPPSPGFSDLPSDHEELFYFSPVERADLEKRKKRRRMDEEREERVRQREEEDRRAEGKEAPKEGEVDWEAGDEPSPTLLSLMLRLHATLYSSPNPQLLELRILANHGSDPRFRSFMRKEGRWFGVWERVRRGEEVGKRKEEAGKQAGGGGGLAGLAAYGSDSDEETEDEEGQVAAPDEGGEAQSVAVTAPSSPPASAPPLPPFAGGPSSRHSNEAGTGAVHGEADEGDANEADEETRRKQKEKQERAREWARKRKEKRGEA